MTLTAAGKKTTKGTVGDLWELVVKASALPDVDDDTANPVRFHITTPDGDRRQVVARPTDGGHTARFVLDRPGAFIATAVVVDAAGAVLEELDGFKASAQLADSAPAPEPTVFDPTAGGTIEATLAYVDTDRDRATEMLVLEQAKGDKARSSLVEQLEAVVNNAA